MNLHLRFVVPLLMVLTLIAYGVTPLIDGLTLRWFTRDLEIRSKLIGNSIEDTVLELMQSREPERTNTLLSKITFDDRLRAAGFCDIQNRLRYHSQYFPSEVRCQDFVNRDKASILKLKTGNLHVSTHTVRQGSLVLGDLIFVHDMTFIQNRSNVTRNYVVLFFVGLGIIISLITILIAQLSWRGWMAAVRTLFKGEGILKPIQEGSPSEVTPLLKDLWSLARQMRTQNRVRDEALVSWTPNMLKEILNRELAGEEIITVSNREPYLHVRDKNGRVNAKFPASGVVTALEPVMRACSGTWIAHGSGNADREFVDSKDCVQVPPDDPKYTLRRVWLSEEEEQGYYYGFANEGLWPLCHIAHTRPNFRSGDWEQYRRVNQKFANALLQEVHTDDPIVLVQDYHFALLPQMIRKKLPKATIITFWHIPWPNPEDFGICPWREEILEGLLGSSVIGFHTQFHCNNFFDTVDQLLECRIDREHFTISHHQKVTAINAYPISIEWPPRWLQEQKSMAECAAQVRLREHLPADCKVVMGVDRLDYTKGILERFLSIEKFLEVYPQWIGKFAFVQIAAPSRSSIDSYQNLDAQVRREEARINAKFKKEQWRPIILKIEHHEPFAVFEYFRASDACFVSSLHDGMNLVAKEYVAAREDSLGVLILSYFAGASRELPEALIVNPYDIDQCAQALYVALTMSPQEQRDRMQNMRGYIREHNVFRWAGRMLMDAAQIRRRSRILAQSRKSDFEIKTQIPR